jgi:carboxylesterase type B
MQIYIFKNIRFAAPPVGNLRWQKPQPPAKETTIQDGKTGHVCVQAQPGTKPIGAPMPSKPAGTIGIGFGNEDCLFLDLFVPGKALKAPATSKLPVVVWVFGGAYSKLSESNVALDIVNVR